MEFQAKKSVDQLQLRIDCLTHHLMKEKLRISSILLQLCEMNVNVAAARDVLDVKQLEDQLASLEKECLEKELEVDASRGKAEGLRDVGFSSSTYDDKLSAVVHESLGFGDIRHPKDEVPKVVELRMSELMERSIQTGTVNSAVHGLKQRSMSKLRSPKTKIMDRYMASESHEIESETSNSTELSDEYRAEKSDGSSDDDIEFNDEDVSFNDEDESFNDGDEFFNDGDESSNDDDESSNDVDESSNDDDESSNGDDESSNDDDESSSDDDEASNNDDEFSDDDFEILGCDEFEMFGCDSPVSLHGHSMLEAV